MRILTVHGSPDPEGNSGRLLQACIEGMKGVTGTEIESISVYDYKVAPVWKDFLRDVMQKTTDRVKDDMPLLKEKMLKADIIVLATPVFWYQLSGKMKLFVDRWSDFINSDWSTGLKGKGLALLSTHSGFNVINSSDFLQMSMFATAQFLGMVWMGAVGGRAEMPWQWDDQTSLAEAKLFGKKLAQGMNMIGQRVL
ncbi:MAG: hypothetical protein A2Z27_02005 [candidate division Zixibacteria bacterium RBG_16_50_21]|nr:MAG: hypothetical protein A2Z27_02005 [candidate division Zixibacteria bacterium RBG_16_50_21]